MSVTPATVKRQKGRGTFFYKSALSGLASFPAPQVIVLYNVDFVKDIKGTNYVRNRVSMYLCTPV